VKPIYLDVTLKAKEAGLWSSKLRELFLLPRRPIHSLLFYYFYPRW